MSAGPWRIEIEHKMRHGMVLATVQHIRTKEILLEMHDEGGSLDIALTPDTVDFFRQAIALWEKTQEKRP